MAKKENIKITKKQEENIISTICGNTTPYERTVSAEWIALASAAHSVEKVEVIVKKYGGKVKNGEIDLTSLRGNGAIGKEYGAIRERRAKELEEIYAKKQAAKKKGARSKTQ